MHTGTERSAIDEFTTRDTHSPRLVFTLKFLKFKTLGNFAVMNLKFNQRGKTIR